MTLLAAVLGLTLLAPALPAAAAPADAWTSPSGGNGNAMVNVGEATITPSTASTVTRAWSTEWANNGPVAPTVTGGVVYYIHRYRSTTDPDTLVAASTKTGQTLWQVELSRPNDRWFQDGVTVAGPWVLISFKDLRTFGAGLIAVDTRTRSIAWTKVTSEEAPQYGWSRHRVYADASRAYVHLADWTVTAYRLSDGRLEWTIPLADTLGAGVALGAGRLFIGYQNQPGITAYDPVTGRKLWTGPGRGTPVVAGGRVFSAEHFTVIALNAAGCGKPTCPALWKKAFPALHPRYVELGAADASTLFVTYQKNVAGADGYYPGIITRLSAATGAREWTRSIGAWNSPVVRGGNVIWVFNEYHAAAGDIRTRILAFAATGTRTTPLRNIPAPQHGSPQTLSIGGGTLFNQLNGHGGLVAFRASGT